MCYIQRTVQIYVYWTVHHCDGWRIKDQLDVTSYFTSHLMCSTCFRHYYIHHQELATALLNYHIGRIVLSSMCVGVSVWLGWNGIRVTGWTVFYCFNILTFNFMLHRFLSTMCFTLHYNIYTHLLVTLPFSGTSVWHMPVAVCTVLNSWGWTERPSKTCRVSFQKK